VNAVVCAKADEQPNSKTNRLTLKQINFLLIDIIFLL